MTRRTARTLPPAAALSAFACFATLAVQTAVAEPPSIGPLVATTWAQRGDHAAFAPLAADGAARERLGCWSVAVAQILFYHRLEPSGKTSYQGTNFEVSADFDAPDVDLSLVAPALRADTDARAKLETARYLWYAALVVGKDFGTGGYIGNTDVRRPRVERHYGVKTSRVKYPASTKAEVAAFVRAELAAGRPLLLYVEASTEGEEGSGHALVVDGVEGEGDGIRIHCNFGWGGESDGWYALWSPLETANGAYDLPDRWIMAIDPPSSSRPAP